MTGPESARLWLRDAQPALAARATLLTAVLIPALVAGHWAPLSAPALALLVLGSSAVTVDLWAFLAPVVLQALALQGAVRGSAPRERVVAALAIPRPQEPGRPGRVRPRAPGVGQVPRPAR